VVSKDLYVLRRAAELFQGISDRFSPNQTDFVALMETWGEGFYTELDFVNEADNQIRFKKLVGETTEGIYVPDVYRDLCRRRVLVTEWIDGVKLTEAPEDEIADLVFLGQECFLKQLLEVGFFHCDPHPGNLMKMNDTSKGRLAILDYGLMAEIPDSERQ
jgi:aarF domain-containing kinase